MKVKELIAKEIDIDCYDNVCESIGIAYCGPMALTEEGQKKFAEVIEYECEILRDPMGYDVCIIKVDDDPNVPWKDKLLRAKEFFLSIAGYCDSDQFDRWFSYID